jgi:hypothetical protein
MPIRQQLNSVGLTPITPKVDYGDPFAGVGSVASSAGAGWISAKWYQSPVRIGSPKGGISYEQIAAMSDLRQISSYDSIIKPLTMPSSVAVLGTQGGQQSRSNRTGSLELNMLDLGATVRMASGSFLGLDTPMLGTPGSGGPIDDALQLMSEYNRLPSRILDYAVGLPLAWLGVQKNSVGAKNADGTTPQPFQQDPVYWNAIANANEAELDEMATRAAYATVGDQMAPALKAQLLAIFKTDQLSMTGMSSGNERTDYLAKKQMETWADYSDKYTKMENGRQVLKSGDPLFQIEANWVAKSGVVFGAFAKGAMTFLPFIGTNLAEYLEPVSEATEARWAAAAADVRRGWMNSAMIAQVASDLIVTLPLFSGLGGFLNFAKAGAAGKEFLPLIQQAKLVQVGLGGERVVQVSESGNSFINVAKHAAWALGKPGVRVPAVLTEGGTVGRVLGSRFAIPEVVHITNIYDGALHVAKLGLMSGISAWGINWGLKIASPEYAATYGREIDNSHWVSESQAAAAVDMIGLFTGGTLGAASLIRVSGTAVGVPLAKVGIKASPFNFAYLEHYGGSGMTSLVQRALKEPLTGAELPFERHTMSVMQRWIQKGFLDHAEMNPARAAEIMAGAQITRGEAMTQLAKILKAAEEKEWGIESEGWRLQHRVAKKQAQALMNDIADLMESETGTKFWNRQLSQMKDPNGRPLAYNAAGLKEAVRNFATMMGKSGDDAVATIESSALLRVHKGERASLKPWQQAANSMMQKAFDRYQGVLQGIRNSGTSESAPGLEIVRLDHLFQEDARRFLGEAEAIANGAGDPLLLEQLRVQIVNTPDFARFWARQKNWHNEGTRSLNDVSAEAVVKWLEQTEMHLPSKRVLPGDNAVEGELNQLHRSLDAGGIWTLAYKATEKTAIGTARAQAKQAKEELVTWVKNRDATRQAAVDAAQARFDRAAVVETEAYAKHVTPAARRLDDLIGERPALQAEFNKLPDTSSPEATALVAKLAKLDERIAKADAAVTKGYDKVEAAKNKDPELKRLLAAETAALEASNLAAKTKPLGYRIGPVMPDGYTADFPEVLDAQGIDGVMRRHIDYQMDAAKAVDPTSGTGIWHATSDMKSVNERGVLDVDEQVAHIGKSASALGGARKPGYVSATYIKSHAEAIADRLGAAIEAANNRMSMEDVLLYFQALPPSLTKRGRGLLDALGRDPAGGQHSYGFDATGSRTSEILLNSKGMVMSNAEYRRWIRKEIKAEMKRPYESVDQIADGLKTGSRIFENEWNRRLNEFTAAKPTWGPNGELISPEIKLANGMTLPEAQARIEQIVTDPNFTGPTAESSRLVDQVIAAQHRAKHPLAPPTDLQKWQILLDVLENIGPGGLNFGTKVTPQFEILQILDGRMDISPGGGVLILSDGKQFLGKTKADAGVVRISLDKNGKKPDFSGDPGEVKVPTDGSFVYRPLPSQPHADPIEVPASQWSQLGPEETYVSWVTLRDPMTGEQVHTTTPYLEYPWQQDLVQLGNRNFLARQFDSITAGYRTWRTTEYMKAQTYRIFTTKYEVEPAQVDALIGEVMRMGYEKWGPFGKGQKAPFAVPLGYQAVANMRREDVTQAAGMIFGREKNALTGEWVPSAIKNKITGEMEVPDYADLLVDSFRQAWTQNLTAALTSKFYSLGSMGVAGQFMGQWLAPLLRYTISPLFKTSELVESAQLNLMRGTPMVNPAMRMEYAAAGMPIKLGQIHSELAAGDMMSQGLMGGLPTIEEAQRLHPNGLSDLPDLPYGYGLIHELKLVADKRRKDSRLPGWMRDGWDNIKDPTIFKDPLAADLSVKVVRDELPLIMQKTNPTAYKHYSDVLKVPDAKIADFIVRDRYLYQGWVDGTVTWQEMTAHQARYNPALAERETAETIAFYASQEWQATEAMFRITARTAQAEAFGVHYFGAYRSSLERSLNHPLLGVYPLSWAYKTAKEWYRFLFDNRVFGNGELRLGATPAAYIQSTMQGQAMAWAQNSNESLDEWLQNGPLGNAFFMFNLLMPGDWANLPFPASRSIRMILRDTNLNPMDHLFQNLAGPRNQYGMGAIRDFNLLRLAVVDGIEELTKADTGDWSKFTSTLNSNGPPPPFDWDKVTKYPTRTLTTPLNAP